MKKFIFYNIIILFLSSTLLSFKNNNNWVIVSGNWMGHDNYIKSIYDPIPISPPGAVNNYNALLLKDKIESPYILKLKFKMIKIANKNQNSKCGIIFDMKDGDNFNAVYIERDNFKTDNFSLIEAQTKNKKSGKKSNNYKFNKLNKKEILNFKLNKWYTIEIQRKKKSIEVNLNPGKIKLLTTKYNLKLSKISFITLNSDCIFNNLEINNKHGKKIIDFKKIKINRLILNQEIDMLPNSIIGL